jgi:hypothetical protein
VTSFALVPSAVHVLASCPQAGRMHRPALSPGKAAVYAAPAVIVERLNCSSQRWQSRIERLGGDRLLGRFCASLGSIAAAVVEWDKPDLPGKLAVNRLSRVTERGLMDRE